MFYQGALSSSHEEKKEHAHNSYRDTFTRRSPDPDALAQVMGYLRDSNRQLSQSAKERIHNKTNFKTHIPEDEEDWLLPVLESLKMYTAPGADGIPNEFYFLLRNCEPLLHTLRVVALGVQ